MKMNNKFLKRNSSTILTCLGVVGLVATSVAAVKATPKAMKLLEQAEEEKGETLTNLEKVKVAGPVYIPAVAIGTASIVCMFGSNVLNKRQQASLASAYAFVDRSYKEYKKKVNELYGNEVEKRVIEEMARDEYEEIDVAPTETEQLFFDYHSLRYFTSSIDDVMEAERFMNETLRKTGYVSVNDMYTLFGLDLVTYGDDMGWSRDDVDEIIFEHSKMTMDDGMECWIVQILTEPY